VSNQFRHLETYTKIGDFLGTTIGEFLGSVSLWTELAQVWVQGRALVNTAMSLWGSTKREYSDQLSDCLLRRDCAAYTGTRYIRFRKSDFILIRSNNFDRF
jgi:hypothetical protein